MRSGRGISGAPFVNRRRRSEAGTEVTSLMTRPRPPEGRSGIQRRGTRCSETRSGIRVRLGLTCEPSALLEERRSRSRSHRGSARRGDTLSSRSVDGASRTYSQANGQIVFARTIPVWVTSQLIGLEELSARRVYSHPSEQSTSQSDVILSEQPTFFFPIFLTEPVKAMRVGLACLFGAFVNLCRVVLGFGLRFKFPPLLAAHGTFFLDFAIN